MNIHTAVDPPTALRCGIVYAAFTPTEVNTMLGVSDATLRRMARAYERVYGRLPTDARQARIYTGDVVKVLEQARELVDGGRPTSTNRMQNLVRQD